ncbi:LPXTG-site transpeptidase (sortase) family protein [Compostimonas suwonensis]|uniref:LPXTG-site transpeptidase (Sortase) family protein n=2 Tax=Compostimonas suwonensis TaxID=1048394 RepID=A0A2M9C372_9MICO|nr:LPXTG-site transpeptidase (sortase) family protein [Compostimonas suwonensis]
MLPPAPLSPTMILVRGFVAMIAILLLGFSVNLLVLSHLQHAVAQQNLFNTFRIELADATAPVSEGTVHDTLVADGAPVALIDIPSIGLREIVVEGTSSGTLTAGPGHRRDTVLPGQAGMSVIMGRAAAYGGPFSRLAELAPGETFQVTTGQGEHVYEVVGLRYAGDPTLPSPKAGEGRLMLQTARGPAYIPTGVEYVDARLVTPAEPAGRRQTTFVALPPSNLAMATDTSTVWALAFALQLLIAAEVAAVWSYRRFGARKIWIVFVPVFVLSGLWVADQVTRLLPNLL